MTRRLTYFLITLGILVLVYLGKSCADSGVLVPAWELQRAKLIEQLRQDGIQDEKVLEAMNQTPREAFVPPEWRGASYVDRPLPIGFGQTISQPYIVALMCQELHLKPTDKVLEIGTGSGYHAAVLSLLCQRVYSIEIIPELALRARDTLDSLGYKNIEVRLGDGYKGWPDAAPFDAIILTAAPEEIPEPLKAQLKFNGRIIAPIGVETQELILIEKTPGGFTQKPIAPVRFVPMTGEAQQKTR